MIELEPPTHILMQYVAPTFGFKPKKPPKEKSTPSKRPETLRQAGKINSGQFDVRKSGMKLVRKNQVPAFVAESANQILERMKAG